MTLPYDLNILDVVLLSVIALFTLRGALRGFLDEVAGLVGILGGVWLAGRYYGELGRIFSQYTTSQWVYIVAYVLILCMVMFVISMISRALHSFLKMAYADWINHLAGAAVGGLKGFLICAVMVTLLTYFINDADFIKKSRMIQLIKETSILGYVGIMDLTKAASYVSSRTYQMFIPLIVAGIMYYLIVKCLSLLLKRFERRLRESD